MLVISPWVGYTFLLTNILKKRICSTCAFIDVVSVMVRPWPVITSEIGNWSVFVLLGWRKKASDPFLGEFCIFRRETEQIYCVRRPRHACVLAFSSCPYCRDRSRRCCCRCEARSLRPPRVSYPRFERGSSHSHPTFSRLRQQGCRGTTTD